jgi:SnoaL-like protein
LTTTTKLALAAVVSLGLFVAWRLWRSDDEHAIRQRLEALTAEINSTVNDGLGTVARAADIGSYFTSNVVVDLGEGAAPIVGRTTLVGMASRLERRTAAFRLRFDDIGVRVGPGATAAAVTLTASFVQRAGDDGEAMDAREFQLGMEKVSGAWCIARVTAVDTLK